MLGRLCQKDAGSPKVYALSVPGSGDQRLSPAIPSSFIRIGDILVARLWGGVIGAHDSVALRRSHSAYPMFLSAEGCSKCLNHVALLTEQNISPNVENVVRWDEGSTINRESHHPQEMGAQ